MGQGTSNDARLGMDGAIEVFARGFALTRSRTHPTEARRVGPAWVIRDRPRERATDYRREQWAAHGVEPAKLDSLVRRRTRGRFCICAVVAEGEPEEALRAEYKALGYRLGSIEPFMVHRLRRVPKVAERFGVNRFRIERVTTAGLAELLRRASGRRMVSEEHFGPDSPLRQYTALSDGAAIGWAGSICVGTSTWVSNVYVAPQFRRRGIGKSLLARLLRDDRAHGVEQSVLLASHAGSLLYASVGYELIGRLLLYTPVRARAKAGAGGT
jgi:GNAT superfamily N-acetyltransferase